jgi:3-isopropylmalate/(R)-2-methylmalate dehydratase large subunit
MTDTIKKTLYDKLWDAHLVHQSDDGSSLIYIDRHIVHEVTSPQAFDGLRLAGRKPWRVDSILATPDHNVPTTQKERAHGVQGIEDPVSLIQVQTLDDNCDEFRHSGIQNQRFPPRHSARHWPGNRCLFAWNDSGLR